MQQDRGQIKVGGAFLMIKQLELVRNLTPDPERTHLSSPDGLPLPPGLVLVSCTNQD